MRDGHERLWCPFTYTGECEGLKVFVVLSAGEEDGSREGFGETGLEEDPGPSYMPISSDQPWPTAIRCMGVCMHACAWCTMWYEQESNCWLARPVRNGDK